MNNLLNTKFGIAKLQTHGYYVIISTKEGNFGKRLHRLIWESIWGKIPKNWVIHHLDGDKRNNCILNLYGMDRVYHNKLHNTGENNPRYGTCHSEETKEKISKAHMGKKISKKTREKISNAHLGKKQPMELVIKRNEKNNTLGIFRVIKHKNITCKQGFDYVYCYMENEKRKEIHSIDILKLKEKVVGKNLPWIVVNEYKVKSEFGDKLANKIIETIQSDTYES